MLFIEGKKKRLVIQSIQNLCLFILKSKKDMNLSGKILLNI